MPKPVTKPKEGASPPPPKLRHRPHVWEVLKERQLFARQSPKSPPLLIKEEDRDRHPGWGFTYEHSKVNFRLPYACDLPDVDFMDNDRIVMRVDGVWYVELRASGMPERGPDYEPQFWEMNSISMTMFYDFRAEILAGNPIPAAVMEHPYLAHYDTYWPRNDGWPSCMLRSFSAYAHREDGEYVKAGDEYVFKPHSTEPRKLTLKPTAKPAPAKVRMRGDEDDEPDLFSTPSPRLRE